MDKITTHITPRTGDIRSELVEVWRHRDLLRYLTKREIYATYANTMIGLFWVLLQPMATAIVMTMVFAALVRVPTGGIPYPLVILSAYPFFLYFNSVVTRSANSMRASAPFLRKVYFPRLIIVLVPVAACTIDLLVMLTVVLIISPFYGVWPSLSWLTLIIPGVLVILLSLGMGLWLSLLTVYSRDVGLALPIMLQVWLYLTPVIYPLGLVPQSWRWFYDLNPMVGIVETARAGLLNGQVPVYSLTATLIITLILLIGGVVFFRTLEDATADLV